MLRLFKRSLAFLDAHKHICYMCVIALSYLLLALRRIIKITKALCLAKKVTKLLLFFYYNCLSTN